MRLIVTTPKMVIDAYVERNFFVEPSEIATPIRVVRSLETAHQNVSLKRSRSGYQHWSRQFMVDIAYDNNQDHNGQTDRRIEDDHKT